MNALANEFARALLMPENEFRAEAARNEIIHVTAARRSPARPSPSRRPWGRSSSPPEGAPTERPRPTFGTWTAVEDDPDECRVTHWMPRPPAPHER